MIWLYYFRIFQTNVNYIDVKTKCIHIRTKGAVSIYIFTLEFIYFLRVLTGAHTLGRTHLQASGHEGAWTMFENWCDFEYYRNLVQEDGNLNWKKGELKRPSDNDTM